MEKLDVIASFDWMDKEWKSHTNLTHAGKVF